MAIGDFTGQNIQDTYQRVVQTDGTNQLADGTGSIFIPVSSSHAITASHALFAISASHETILEISSSHAVNADTASFATNFTASGNISASGTTSTSQVIIPSQQHAVKIFNKTALGNTDEILNLGKDANWSSIEYGRGATSLHNFLGRIVVPNITASGNISASGTIVGSNLSGTNTGDITLTGTPDYITISNQVITRNQIDLANDVTGVLPSANLDADTAHLTTDQTFSGKKTFSAAITASGNISSSGDISSFKYIEATQTVAASGTGIGDATAIAATAGRVFVTTNDNAKGVKLPAVSSVTIGTTFTIHNTVDGNTLEVYPFGDDRIFPLADDAPATLPANTAMVVTAFSADGYVGYFTTVIS